MNGSWVLGLSALLLLIFAFGLFGFIRSLSEAQKTGKGSPGRRLKYIVMAVICLLLLALPVINGILNYLGKR